MDLLKIKKKNRVKLMLFKQLTKDCWQIQFANYPKSINNRGNF